MVGRMALDKSGLAQLSWASKAGRVTVSCPLLRWLQKVPFVLPVSWVRGLGLFTFCELADFKVRVLTFSQ